MTLPALPYHIAQAIGVMGFCLYVTAYTLLTLRLLPSTSIRYFQINLTASVCVLIGLSVSFNLAAALIQLFWVAMSLIGISMQMFRPRT